MKKYLEVCIRCGFVHRDDRTKTRQRKTHYHWRPEKGEQLMGDIIIHATICHGCVSRGGKIDWREYAQARFDTPDQYYIPDSFNATLPKQFISEKLDEEYFDFCEAIISDFNRTRG